MLEVHDLKQAMLLAANIALEQEVIVAGIPMTLFIIRRVWYTPTHIQSKPSIDFVLRLRYQLSK